MQAKSRVVKKVFGWISLGIGIFGSVLLIVNACFPGGLSGAISSFIFINTADALNPGHSAPTIEVTGATLRFATTNLNTVEGYEQNEIPVGCTKVLEFVVEPSNATNTDYTYKCSRNDVVITREGKTLYVQPNSLGDFTIECTSKSGNFTKSQEFTVSDLMAPQNFNAEDYDVAIKNGESYLYLPEYLSDYVKSPLMSVRYYDASKLTYTSSDGTIATVSNNGYIVAKSVGETSITISNGVISKTINVTVTPNEETIIEPTSLEVNADKTILGIQDMDYDRNPKEGECFHAHISVNWGNNPTDKMVSFISDNPLVAKVDTNGNVRGYRQKGTANITVTSVRNPALSQTIEFTVDEVAITDFEVDEKKFADLTVGKNRYITPIYSPRNASDTAFLAESSDPTIFTAVGAGRSINVSALKEGTATITIYPKSNPDVKKSYTLTAVPYSISDDPSYSEYHNTFRKVIGHLSAFAVTSLFVSLGLVLLFADFKKIHYFLYLISASYGIFLASFTEFLQTIIPNRNGSFNDILIDSGGYLIGVIIILIIFGTIELVMFIRKKAMK